MQQINAADPVAPDNPGDLTLHNDGHVVEDTCAHSAGHRVNSPRFALGFAAAAALPAATHGSGPTQMHSFPVTHTRLKTRRTWVNTPECSHIVRRGAVARRHCWKQSRLPDHASVRSCKARCRRRVTSRGINRGL